MGNCVKILGLPKSLHRSFRRALALSGAGSQSQWLHAQVRRLIREQQELHGDNLLRVLTSEESEIVSAIQSGAAEFPQIVEESMIAEHRVRAIIDDLVERGIVQERRKGGKTDGARGAAVKLYFAEKE